MQKDRGIRVWGELLLTGHRQTRVSAFPLSVLEKLVLWMSSSFPIFCCLPE